MSITSIVVQTRMSSITSSVCNSQQSSNKLKMNTQEPNSSKIMEKLKEIKRIFNENEPVYQPYQPLNSQSHHLSGESRENSRLRKYLPQSASRNREPQEERNNPIIQMRDNDHNIFKSQLESKMETLFNEEKSLLRNRYDLNDEEYDLGRTGKFREEKESLIAMERKIKDLEGKFSTTKPPIAKRNKEQVKKKREDKDPNQPNQREEKEVFELKQALTEMRLLNQKLMNKLLKQKQQKSSSKDSIIDKLSIQVDQLRKQLSQIKSKPPYVVCPARVQSRERAITSFAQNHKKVQHSILVELYSQIEELQFKVSHEQRERLGLESKNSWLEGQLRRLTQ